MNRITKRFSSTFKIYRNNKSKTRIDSFPIDKKELQRIATKLRKKIITTSHKAKIPHLGSCLSCIDL